MANYYTYSKTNYFRVTDSEELKRIVKTLPDAEVDEVADGRFCIYSYDSLTEAYDEHGEVLECCPLTMIANVLPDDEAVVILEIGHEKLRYLHAGVIIVTNKGIKYLSFLESTKDAIMDMLNVTAHNVDLGLLF